MRPITKCQTTMMPHDGMQITGDNGQGVPKCSVCRSDHGAGLMPPILISSHRRVLALLDPSDRMAVCRSVPRGFCHGTPATSQHPPRAPWHDLARRRGFSSVSARPPPLGELRTDSRRAAPLIAPCCQPGVRRKGRCREPWTLRSLSVMVIPRIWPDHRMGNPMIRVHRSEFIALGHCLRVLP